MVLFAWKQEVHLQPHTQSQGLSFGGMGTTCTPDLLKVIPIYRQSWSRRVESYSELNI